MKQKDRFCIRNNGVVHVDAKLLVKSAEFKKQAEAASKVISNQSSSK